MVSTKQAAVIVNKRPEAGVKNAKGPSPEPKPVNYVVNIAGVQHKVSYESLFVQGHDLWLKRDFPKAFKIFDLLSTATDRGPRAAILKAHCSVMEKKFCECSSILWQALPKENYAMAAAQLHDIFVLWKFTFYNEVRRELEEFVIQFSDLPTPALMLGDFFSRAGHYEKAMKYLRLACERDRKDGAIARIAQIEHKLLSNKERGILP